MGMESVKMGASEPKTVKRTCKYHGDYETTAQAVPGIKNIFQGVCPKCQEDIERKSQEEHSQHEAERRKTKQGRYDRAGIPKRFRSKNFENFKAETIDQQRAKNIVQQYADNFDEVSEIGQSMIFSGKTGTGKTHLATAVANQVIRNGRTAAFITVRDLVAKVRETWSRKSEISEAELKKYFIGVGLLVLDEIGVQFDTEAEKLIIFDVINGRYEEVMPTIVLSNFPFDSEGDDPSIKKVLGDRVTDRLREGGGKLVRFEWKSQRAQA